MTQETLTTVELFGNLKISCIIMISKNQIRIEDEGVGWVQIPINCNAYAEI